MKRQELKVLGLGMALASMVGGLQAQVPAQPPAPAQPPVQLPAQVPPQLPPQVPGMPPPMMGAPSQMWDEAGRRHGAGRGDDLADMAGDDSFILRAISNPRVAKELGLTDEQIAGLREKIFGLKQKQIELGADLEKVGLQQAKLMSEKKIDEAAVMAQVEKAGALRTEQAKLRVQGLLILKKTLSDEQIEKAREMVGDRMGMRRGPDMGGESSREAAERRREMMMNMRARGMGDKDKTLPGPAGEGVKLGEGAEAKKNSTATTESKQPETKK